MNLINKETLHGFKSKIRNEIESANNKENYLNKEDRDLLSTFIKKTIKELNLN